MATHLGIIPSIFRVVGVVVVGIDLASSSLSLPCRRAQTSMSWVGRTSPPPYQAGELDADAVEEACCCLGPDVAMASLGWCISIRTRDSPCSGRRHRRVALPDQWPLL